MAIKAKEFDKVDFFKQLAETEGKLKIFTDEKAHLDVVIEEERMKNDKLKSEYETANNKIHQLQNELAHHKQTHNQNLDTFDSKFDQIHAQLEQANLDGLAFKQKLKMTKDTQHDLEKEKNYWRDKCRNAERKGEEINQKIAELEAELRSIIFDKLAAP